MNMQRSYRLGEFHTFDVSERRFLYLVPAGAIFELDGAARSAVDQVAGGTSGHGDLVSGLAGDGLSPDDAEELLLLLVVVVASNVSFRLAVLFREFMSFSIAA